MSLSGEIGDSDEGCAEPKSYHASSPSVDDSGGRDGGIGGGSERCALSDDDEGWKGATCGGNAVATPGVGSRKQ